MNSSSEDAIRFAQGEQGSESSTNWYLLLFAVIVTLFAVYWGFVRPTSRQLTKLRRYVTSLESSVADLNVQRLDNGQTVSALERMVEQDNATQEALSALREMRDLHRQIVQESEQLGTAREALESLAGLRAQVVRQSSLISSTSQALESLKSLRTQISSSANETEDAKRAVNKLSMLRDGLIDGINRLDETQPLIDQVQAVQQQIVELAEDAGVTEVAVSQMDNVQSRVQEQMASLIEGAEATEQTASRVELTQSRVQQQMSELMAGTDQTEATINKVDALHDRIQSSVADRTDDVATAIETLELATDVKLEMKRAGDTFITVKRMLSEFSLMRPALQQALDSLQPLSELADLRRLGVHELRRVAMNIESRDTSLAHSSVAEPLNETIDTGTFAQPADPIDQISEEAAEVSLAEIPELTDLSTLGSDQFYETTDVLLNDLVASETGLTATATDPEPVLPTPNWTENEIVQAVVKAVSDAAREFTETVEVANANEATVK